MASALEKLVKILRLEREQGCKNTAVIGGLERFAGNWAQEAHAQAKKPEHHELVDELVALMERYPTIESPDERRREIKYMLDRILQRVPPRQGIEAIVETSHVREWAPEPSGAAAPAKPEEIEAQLAAWSALEEPVTEVPRVGKTTAEKLARMGIHTVGDLLFCFPRRYDDYSRQKLIHKLVPGETVTVIPVKPEQVRRLAHNEVMHARSVE